MISMYNRQNTLIVIYKSLMVGGIENYVARIMRNSLKSGKRVIWICNTGIIASDVYSDILSDPHLEIIEMNFSGFNIYKIPKISFRDNEHVKVLVFDIFHLFQAYKFRKEYRKICLDILYCVPHFTGSTILPEQGFNCGFFKRIVQDHLSKIYDHIFKQGNLYFFSSKHYAVLQDTYGIKFFKPQDYLLPNLEKREDYDEKAFRKVYNSGVFTIISPGRFEFPHKGYLIGLIDAFKDLKLRYSQLKLLIIGDGQDKNQLYKIVDDLPLAIRKDIEIKPSRTSEELIQLMKASNLNISVAGCAIIGARNGLITLPARHYVYDCEVYGFFPESRNQITDTKPGAPVKEYIEQVINMKEDEYIKYSKLAYHTFDDEKYDENFPFVEHPITNYIPTQSDFLFLKLVYNFQRLNYFIRRFRKG